MLFYANGSKEKNGIVPIMGRVTINGTVAQFGASQRSFGTQRATVSREYLCCRAKTVVCLPPYEEAHSP